MRSILSVLACIAVLAPTAATHAAVILSNLANASGATPIIGDNDGDVSAAAGFTTGANAAGYTLNSATMAFTSASDSPDPTFQLELFTEVAGLPGASLLILSGSASPISGLFTYVGSVLLNPNTNYFLVSSAVQPFGSYKAFRHSSTANTSETSSDGWSIDDALLINDEFGDWSSFSQQARFSIDATVNAASATVPVPATLGCLVLGMIGIAAVRRRSSSGYLSTL